MVDVDRLAKSEEDAVNLLGSAKRIKLPEVTAAAEPRRRGVIARSVEDALRNIDTDSSLAAAHGASLRHGDAATPGYSAAQLAAGKRNAEAPSPALEAYQRRVDNLRNGLGPLAKLLKKPGVTDINRNPDGQIFISEVGEAKYKLDEFVMSDVQVLQIIGAVSTYAGITIDEKHPRLEAILPDDGSRFTAVIPPATFPGPTFAIRKHSVLKRTLDDYVSDGILSKRDLVTIRKGIHEHDNFLIVGSTGSGKTTFANALLTEMAQNASERFIIIEDNPEIQCPADDQLSLRTTEHVSMNDHLRTVLRLTPDRIIIGEVRGAEAHSLIKLWNTGHKGGLTTIHSESVSKGLTRLEQCIQEAGVPVSRPQIADSVQMIVVIRKTEGGRRRVTEIKRITGADETKYFYDTL
jgi:type IV secretion system protein VirB11